METSDRIPSQQEQEARLATLAAEIESDFNGKPLVALCLLKESFTFFADLTRALPLSIQCEFLETGAKERLFNPKSLHNKHVLLVQERCGEPQNLSEVISFLKEAHPQSIRRCVWIQETAASPKADYVGFDITP